MEFIRRKIKWTPCPVETYDSSEYAGDFNNPNFVEIQQAEPGDCVVAKQAKTGYWYWFRENDTLLPWFNANDTREGACEVHEGKRRSFLPSRAVGPFATENGAKSFGADFARKKAFDKSQENARNQRFEKAREALYDLLKRSEDDE